MKFIMSRQDLSDVVSTVQNIVAPRTPMPILSNVLLEAGQDYITVTATDLTVAVRCTKRAHVQEIGGTTLPARKLGQLLKELTAAHIELSANQKDIATILSDDASFKLHGMSRADFPTLPDLSGATRITVPQATLSDLFFKTSFAVSREDNRYALTGVSFSIHGGVLLFIGTDGKRLARAHTAITCDPSLQYECIIPSKAVDEFMKILSKDEGDATLYLLPDKVALEANQSLILTKLLSGDYPDVERVIPKSSHFIVKANREELISRLRQVSLFITESNHSVRFTFEEGQLNLNANTADLGEGRVRMPVQYSGGRFDIAFNPTYCIDILRHCREEVVTIGLQDAFNPAVISDVPFEKQLTNLLSPLFVLMPMRLTDE